jgi:cyclic AMP-responsive element-binding protein 3
MQLSQASHNLLKSQQSQLMLDSPTSQQQQQQQQQQQRLMMPKFNVKMETQSSTAFGLPPTPPSSLPSDESEGNQSPEHRLSPMSPPAPVAGHSRRNSHTAMGGHHSSPTYTSSSSSRNFTSSSSGSTRQPIHTPLISSQPVSSESPKV